MASVTVTDEFTSSIAAPRLFKALVLKADKLIPQIAPQSVKSIEVLEGNGGPGAIKQINFAQGGEFKYMKHRIDGLDVDNMSYTYTWIGREPSMEKLEKVCCETKLESGLDGGTKGKSGSTYYAKAGHEIKEEEIKEWRKKPAGFFKAVEAYLLANPNVFA